MSATTVEEVAVKTQPEREDAAVPEGWERLSVAALVARGATIRTGPFGTLLKAAEYSVEGVPVVSVREIGAGSLNITDETPRVPPEVTKRLPEYRLNSGDIIFGRKGAVDRSALIGVHQDGWFLGSDGIRLRLPTFVEPGYAIYQFQTREARSWLLSNSVGTTMASLNQEVLGRVPILIASQEEQRAIAEALSDVDALIGALDKVIVKKVAIKLATMQQLLTGKIRLPGFHGEWQVKRLGDIAHIKTGTRNNEDKVDDGQFPFFVRSEQVERIDSFSHDCEAILIPGEGRIGSIFHYVNGRFDVHQRVYAITRFSPDVSGKFVYYFMSRNFGPWAMQKSVKATVDSLRLPTFQTFEIVLPPTIGEQNAIATTISDLDAGIDALARRRDKVKAIKQGMMQQLLTGRIRLV